MVYIRTVLYLAAALLVLFGAFAVLPWEMLNAFMRLFSPLIYPDDPIVQYTIRGMYLLILWLGVLLALAVRRPRAYGPVLFVFGGLFLSWAGLSVFLVRFYDLPLIFYGDAVYGIILGVLFFFYRWKASEENEG
jgi:hypothetical protein